MADPNPYKSSLPTDFDPKKERQRLKDEPGRAHVEDIQELRNRPDPETDRFIDRESKKAGIPVPRKPKDKSWGVNPEKPQTMSVEDAFKPVEKAKPQTISVEEAFKPQKEKGGKAQTMSLEEAFAKPEPEYDDMGFVEGAVESVKNFPDVMKQNVGGLMELAGEQEGSSVAGPVFDSFARSLVERFLPDQAPESKPAENWLTKKGTEIADEARKEVAGNMPKLEPGSPEYYAYHGTTSLGLMVPSVVATVLSKNPNVGLSMFGPMIAGTEYDEARRSGRSVDEATMDTAVKTAAETISERIPLGTLTKAGGRYLWRVGKSALSEGVQEVVNEGFNMLYDRGVLGEETTAEEAKRRALDAFVLGSGVGAAFGVPAQMANPGARAEQAGDDISGDVDPTQSIFDESEQADLNQQVEEEFDFTQQDEADENITLAGGVEGTEDIQVEDVTPDEEIDLTGADTMDTEGMLDIETATEEEAAPETEPTPDAAPEGGLTPEEQDRAIQALEQDLDPFEGDAQDAQLAPEAIEVEEVQPETITVEEAFQEPAEPARVETAGELDAAVQQAATSPVSEVPEPTEAQKSAGNYKKGKVKIGGFDISVENPKGSTRSGTNRAGEKWSQTMKDHYGYIRGTKGRDKDHLDVFMTDKATDISRPVFVVDQVDPETGNFDEHKIVMGAANEKQARRVYKRNYEKGWKGLGNITKMSQDEFKDWTQGDTTQPVAEKRTSVADKRTVAKETAKPATESQKKPEKTETKGKKKAAKKAETRETDQGTAMFSAEKGGATVKDAEKRIRSRHALDTFSLSERDGDIVLNNMVATEKGTGAGTAAMKDLAAYASQTGRRIILTPGQRGDGTGTTSAKRLKRFYKRFGFVENKGRNKDFSISEGMYREPNNKIRPTVMFSQEDPTSPLHFAGIPGLVETAKRYDDFETFFRESAGRGRRRREYLRSWMEAKGIDPVSSDIDRGDGIHSPASPDEGAPLYDVAQDIYPEDVYSGEGLRYYGTGDDSMDSQAWGLIMDAEAAPEKQVKVYRAVEKDGGPIRPGDWVTTIRRYATEHGRANLNNEFRITTKTVRAKDLYTDGNSWMEWGYHPQPKTYPAGASIKRAHRAAWRAAHGEDTNKTQKPMLATAYHGSPYKFDRFDISKIGTGEGAAAFGHGLYLAENPNTAEIYAQNLGFTEIEDLGIGSVMLYRNGEPVDYSPRSTSDQDTAKALLQETMLVNEWEMKQAFEREGADGVAKVMRRTVEELKDSYAEEHPPYGKYFDRVARQIDQGVMKPKVKMQRNEFRYTVDIPDSAIDKMLDWDKPLRDQPKNVRDALERLGVKTNKATPAGNVFRSMEGMPEAFLGRTGATKADVSQALKEAGIPGIKYLDQVSRDKGEGTRNFVVFDDSLITILERNGEPVTGAERDQALMSMQPGDVTQTEAFRRWFKDSKVVDENGEPLVVYKGNREDVRTYAAPQSGPEEGGIFFTSEPWVASEYAPSGRGPNVVPAYLKIENPLVIDGKGKVKEKNFGIQIRAAKLDGHDGVIIKNVVDLPSWWWDFNDPEGNLANAMNRGELKAGSDVYVAFEPTQIKSAIGNRGTFDPTDPNILRAQGQRSGVSTDEARSAIVERFGEKAISDLEASGLFTIAETPADLPLEVQKRLLGEELDAQPSGLHEPDTGQSWIFTRNIPSRDRVYGVFLHEVGAHYGMPQMLGKNGYKLMKKQLRELAKTDDRVKMAIWRVPDNTPDEYFWDEVLAYLVQHEYTYPGKGKITDPLTKVIRQALAKIKAFLQRKGFLHAKDMGVDDMVELVKGAAARAAETAVSPEMQDARISAMASQERGDRSDTPQPRERSMRTIEEVQAQMEAPIFRAGQDSTGDHWTFDPDVAAAYQHNEPFGGENIYATEGKDLNILDVRGEEGRFLEETVGRDIGIEHGTPAWAMESDQVKEYLKDNGYDAVRYLDDFPNGADVMFVRDGTTGEQLDVPETESLLRALDSLSIWNEEADVKADARHYVSENFDIVDQDGDKVDPKDQREADMDDIRAILEGERELVDGDFVYTVTPKPGSFNQPAPDTGALFSKEASSEQKRERLRRLGLDFENLPGDEEGSQTRAQVTEEEPETVDTETAKEQLRKRGYGDKPMFSTVTDEQDRGTIAHMVTGEQKPTFHPSTQKQNKLKRYVKRYFTKEGLMTNEAFQRHIQSQGIKGEDELIAQFMVDGMVKAAKKSYKKSWAKISERDKAQMNEYLAGNNQADVPAPVKRGLDNMRTSLDSLSGRVQQMLIDEIMYRLHALNPEQREAALALIQKRDQELTEEDMEGVDPIVARKVMMYRTIEGNKRQYLNRSYAVFDNDNWVDEVSDEVKERARAFLRAQIEEDAQMSQWNDQAKSDYVDGVMNKILNPKGTDLMSFMNSGQLGQKDLSIMKKRKEIAPEIRELMGEYKDPRLNYTRSMSKMSYLVANHHFLRSVREDGLGVFLSAQPSGHMSEQITSWDENKMAPLAGLYASPEFAQALRDAAEPANMATWLRNYMLYFNVPVKYGKTVISPTTTARNFLSASLFTVMNGNFNYSYAVKAGANTWADLGSSNPKRMRYLRKLVRLGVLHDNPRARELQEALDEAADMNALEGSLPARALKTTLNTATKVYRAGDDFWKIIGFENTKDDLMRAGMAEAEAEAMAADRVRNGYPTYSMVPAAIRGLRRFPVVGTFVSFPWEIMRTTRHQFRFLREDWNAGRQYMAGKRAVGMAIAGSIAHGISMATMGLFGLDDEDDEAIRQMAPEWQQNAQLAYLPPNEEGQMRYLDLSHLDPYTYLKIPFTAMANGNYESIDEAALAGMQEFMEPFLGTEIGFGALLDVWTNSTEYGPVYDDNAHWTVRGKQIYDHLRKELQPGVVSNIERTIKAWNDVYTSYGKKYELTDENLAWVGLRISTMNPEISLRFRSFDFNRQASDANHPTYRVFRDPNVGAYEEIPGAVSRSKARWKQAFKDMHASIRAARKIGMENREIVQALRDGEVARKHIGPLMNGDVPPWRPYNPTLEKARSSILQTRDDPREKKALMQDFRKRREALYESLSQ